jgi:hypothetical protein
MSVRSNNGKSYANALEKHKAHKQSKKNYAMSKAKTKGSSRSK